MTGLALLNPKAADHLCKLLGMLGSSHDGERAAAGRKAHEFLHQFGLSWRDIIHVPPEWQHMAKHCRGQAHRLSAREFEFVNNISMSRRHPSDRQLEWLRAIFAKIGGGP
jgi:hypothetical protein